MIEKISNTHDSMTQESHFINHCQQLSFTTSSPSVSDSEPLLELESFRLSLDFLMTSNS